MANASAQADRTPVLCSDTTAAIDWRVELACPLASLAIWLCYQGFQTRISHRRPLKTTRGMMIAARRSWVAKNLHGGMVPVNTLRDFMRAAQFMANTSVLVVLAATSCELHGPPSCCASGQQSAAPSAPPLQRHRCHCRVRR